MDCFGGKKNSNKSQLYEESLRFLTSKVKLLEEEMRAMVNERLKESEGYERDMVVYAFREAEWKQEKKRLREEVKKLKEVVEEKEEKISEMEVIHEMGLGLGEVRDEEKHVIEKGCCDGVLTVERSYVRGRRVEWWRDEAVDKWKKLYLAIKTELDDLIQRTHSHGDALSWRAEEEEIIEELKMEVKAKEEAIEELKARVKAAEQEAYKKEREIDILRQSFRIISSTKKSSSFSLTMPKLPLIKKST